MMKADVATGRSTSDFPMLQSWRDALSAVVWPKADRGSWSRWLTMHRAPSVCLALLALVGATEAQATTLAAGNRHSLEIRGGKLYAWGQGSYGQLGDGTTPNFRSTPGLVSLPAGVTPTAVAAGDFHSMAIGSDGKLYAWGNNNNGQLGDGSLTWRSTPVIVTLPAGVAPTAVDGGGDHSLAIASNGKVYAWGDNFYGELGDGSTTNRGAPVVVGLPAGITARAVTAGVGHSLAIGSDGKLYAWGNNNNGQLGDGSYTQRNTPVIVNLPAGVTPTALAAGYWHSLAIGSDGNLYAWGANGNGQLGDRSTTGRSTPVVVSLPIGVAPQAVSAGDYHSMAVGSDGKLYTWGSSIFGALGDGTVTARSNPLPVSLPGGIAPTALAGGGYFSLALGSNGTLYSWGENIDGQLGDGSYTQRNTPVPVTGYPFSSGGSTDAPVPLWALGALGAGLVGIASRRQRKVS